MVVGGGGGGGGGEASYISHRNLDVQYRGEVMTIGGLLIPDDMNYSWCHTDC